MTLKIDLAELRARVEGRKQQRADRAAALRDRGVAVLPTTTKKSLASKQSILARVLPWRRPDDL
jgi:hypothetical protein